MVYFFVSIILILTGIIIFQYRLKISRDYQIKYIYEKLDKIIEDRTSENLLVFTDDKELIHLLIGINNLLNHNKKILADYAKNDISIISINTKTASLEDYFLSLIGGEKNA